MRLQMLAMCVVIGLASTFALAQTTRPSSRPTTRPFQARQTDLSAYGLTPQPERKAPVQRVFLYYNAHFPIEQTPQGSVIVTDGQRSRPYRDVEIRQGKFDANEDFTKYALIVTDDQNQKHVFFDGKEGPAHKGIARVAMSPDGKRLAYVASGENFRWTLYLDGKPQGDFFDVSDIIFGPAGAVAWLAADEQPTEPGKGYDIYVNGQRYDAKFRWVYGESDGKKREFHFSPDGKRFAVLGQVHGGGRHDGGIGGYAVMIDGKIGPVHKDIVPHSLQFSADGSHVFYAAGTPTKGDYAVYKNFQPGKSRWNFIHSLQVSRDGARYAFVGFDGAQEGRWLAQTHAHGHVHWSPGAPNLIVDDQLYERSVVQFGASENLGHLVYVRMQMENNFNGPIKEQLFLDKKPVADLGEETQISSMRVSPSGKHWAMVAEPRFSSRLLLIDGDRRFAMPSDYTPYDAIPRDDGKYDVLLAKARRNGVFLFDPAKGRSAERR